MLDIAIYINPNAGRSHVREIEQSARRCLWGYNLNFIVPKSREAGLEAIAALKPNTCRALIVCGGDGTINFVLPAVMESGVPLLPMPFGTANDLATTLGIECDWYAAQHTIDQTVPKALDLIQVNDQLFATVGGIGMGALLSAEINHLRAASRVFKTLSEVMREQIYTLMTAKAILLQNTPIHRVRLTTDHEIEELDTRLILICNQENFAGDLIIAPGADHADGTMEVAIFDALQSGDMLFDLLSLKRGIGSERIRVIKTKQLVIEELNDSDLLAFGDGDPLVKATRLSFSVLPGALRIFGPAATSVLVRA